MVSYAEIPTLPIDALRPRAFLAHVPGQGIEGPKNGLGQASAIDYSGGGSVAVSFEAHGMDGLDHEIINWLDARLSGSFRFINVPILTDRSGLMPLYSGSPYVNEPHSDGFFHDDGYGYADTSVWGQATANAALNAGVISLDIFGAQRALRFSDWFSIRHETKGWRAYRYWRVISRSNGDTSYTLAIAPALREAIVAGTRIEFVRPLCAMRFPSGKTVPWAVSGPWVANPAFEFVEAF